MRIPHDRTAARLRVLALLNQAAVAAPTPEAARDWLHAPQPDLGGLSPAAAAWLSYRGLERAGRALRALSPPNRE